MSALSGLGQQKRAFNWIFYGAVDITLHIIHKEAANIEIIFQKDKNEINRLSNAGGATSYYLYSRADNLYLGILYSSEPNFAI